MYLRITRLGKGCFAILSTKIYAFGARQHIANELHALGVPADHIASLFLELRTSDEVSYDCQ